MSTLIRLAFLLILAQLTLAYRFVHVYNGCVVPNVPKNGRFVGGKFTSGSLRRSMTYLNFECDAGFSKTIDTPVLCRNNGYWSDEMRCAKMCQALEWSDGDIVCEKENQIIPCGDRIKNGTVITAVCKTGGQARITCVNGEWDRSLPNCNPETCQALEWSDGDIVCKKENQTIPCGDRIKNGTVITAICKTVGQARITCVNGKWDRSLPNCNPVQECGNAKINQQTNGSPNRGKSPWNVAVYYLGTNICGGTIISTHIIMSAAHCYWNSNLRELYSNTLYYVGIGKLYKAFYNPELGNKYMQRLPVSNIKIPNGYELDKLNLNIALLFVENPVHFNEFIQPICLDLFNQRFDEWQTAPQTFGQIAGWNVLADEQPIGMLRVIDLPVLNYSECQQAMPSSFSETYSKDRICTNSLNGDKMCTGDGGAGLVFPSLEDGGVRWYLRGVLSVGDLADSDDRGCHSNYSGYTRVFNHVEWIMRATSSLSN